MILWKLAPRRVVINPSVVDAPPPTPVGGPAFGNSRKSSTVIVRDGPSEMTKRRVICSMRELAGYGLNCLTSVWKLVMIFGGPASGFSKELFQASGKSRLRLSPLS